jgi:hypothetical protein
MRRGFLCHGCGATFPHKPGADLFCSQDCEKKYLAKAEAANEQLKTAGFTRDQAIPNVWWKDAIAVTQEHVLHEGIDKALAKHNAGKA